MTLSGELQARLDTLIAQRDSYRYTGVSTNEKTLVAFIAPTAAGKSTLIEQVLKNAELAGVDAGEVGTWTTRPGRATDPTNYRTDVSMEEMIALIEQGGVTNWSLFPTGHIYASVPESFPAIYNFLPLIPDSLPMLKRAGFKAVEAFYVTVPLAQWQQQLQANSERDGFNKRLYEAHESLDYAATHETELLFVNNISGEEHLDMTANSILDYVTKGLSFSVDPSATKQRDDMRQYVEEHLNGNV